jgi:hypothetical protein
MVSIGDVRAHLRLDDNYPAEQLQVYIGAAASAAEEFLNRRIFPSDTQRLEAIARVPARLAQAVAAHAAAIAAADLVEDLDSRLAEHSDADATLREARAAATEVRRGIVAGDQIRAAILLTIGHLFANREDSTDKQLQELPQGCKWLLQPFRIGLGV